MNRIEISKAYEAMRKNQLKQGRLNRQRVSRVCEDIMQLSAVQHDKDLEQFGRNYLQKLYSLEQEATNKKDANGMTPAQ